MMTRKMWNTETAPMHQDEFEALAAIVVDETWGTLDRMTALERLVDEMDREERELPPELVEQQLAQFGAPPARDDLEGWAQRFRDAEAENARQEAEHVNDLIGPWR